MAKRRKDELEEPLVDLGDVGQQAIGFYEKNQRIILGVLAGIGVLVVGYFAYVNFYKAPLEQEATAQMHKAEFAFQQDSFAKALNDPGGDFPGFIDLADNYSGTKAGNLAHYYAGVSFLRLGNYDKAIKYLNKYSAKEPMTKAMKKGMLGDAYSELKNYSKAISLYKDAASASGDDLTAPYYLKKAGMLLEMQGKPADALKQYEKIRDNYYKTPQGQQGGIEKYIARVKAKI
jgi:tetratricopeptide (TPR) repeat protein